MNARLNATATAAAAAAAAAMLAVADDQAEYVYLALRRLAFDDDNVRTRSRGDIAELNASIAANGVLQNFVVSPVKTPCKARRKHKGAGIEVTDGVGAGARRLRVLLELVKDEVIDLDYQVLCRRVQRSRAVPASTAENTVREDMSTADVLRAFARMVRDGAGVEALAQQFGVSPLTVQRRLRSAVVCGALIGTRRAASTAGLAARRRRSRRVIAVTSSKPSASARVKHHLAQGHRSRAWRGKDSSHRPSRCTRMAGIDPRLRRNEVHEPVTPLQLSTKSDRRDLVVPTQRAPLISASAAATRSAALQSSTAASLRIV